MVRPCIYGVWDAKNKRCAYLTPDNKCGKYDTIVDEEKDSAYPMMGSGCSSALYNTRRDAKIRENNKTASRILKT